MKALRHSGRSVYITCAFIAGCAASFFIGHCFGYAQGNSRYVTYQKGAFVLALGVLEDLRRNRLEPATHRLEGFCYATAVGVLENRSRAKDAISSIFVPSLVEYRRKYATNPPGPMEARLDSLLPKSETGSLNKR